MMSLVCWVRPITTIAVATSSSWSLPADSQARHITDGNVRDILDLDRKTARLGQDDVLDILDLVALGDVVGAAAVDQSDAADIDRLLADRDLAAADIDVGIAERGDQLGHRDIVGFQLLRDRRRR